MLGDLNGWVEDGSGGFEFPEENDNGRRGIGFCAERGLPVSNTYFKHKSLHKYNRVAKSQDGAEVMNMINLVLMKKDMLHYV